MTLVTFYFLSNTNQDKELGLDWGAQRIVTTIFLLFFFVNFTFVFCYSRILFLLILKPVQCLNAKISCQGANPVQGFGCMVFESADYMLVWTETKFLWCLFIIFWEGMISWNISRIFYLFIHLTVFDWLLRYMCIQFILEEINELSNTKLSIVHFHRFSFGPHFNKKN